MDVVLDNFPVIFKAFLMTLRLTLIACAFGLLLGLVLATFRVSPIRPLRAFATGYTNLMISMPIAVWVALFYFGFPKIDIAFRSNDLGWDNFRSGLVAIALWVSAYFGEAIRSGINAVPSGQAEAARAIGLPFSQVLGSVILPQALRGAILPLGVILNATYRNSAAVSFIGVADIINVTQERGDTLAAYAQFTLAAFVCYLLLSVVTNAGFLALDKKYSVKR
jgi:His/Glu/Gln/Arg/opine family amino acid ABC transporter permease subunit